MSSSFLNSFSVVGSFTASIDVVETLVAGDEEMIAGELPSNEFVTRLLLRDKDAIDSSSESSNVVSAFRFCPRVTSGSKCV